jgi:hypothetical protein
VGWQGYHLCLLPAADLFAQGTTKAEVACEPGVSAQTAGMRAGGNAGMHTARQRKPAQLGPAELAKIGRKRSRPMPWVTTGCRSERMAVEGMTA